MTEPIKLSLALFIRNIEVQRGGDDIIERILNSTKQTDNVELISTDLQYTFELDSTLNTREFDVNNSRKLKYYTYDSVKKIVTFAIKYKSGDYLLRVAEAGIIHLVENKYIVDRKIISSGIPVIQFYGEIAIIDLDKPKFEYMIVPHYSTDMINLDATNKRHFIISLIQHLDHLQSDFYVHTNLRYDSLGYDLNYNCVFVDYDATTLLDVAEFRDLYPELFLQTVTRTAYISEAGINSKFVMDNNYFLKITAQPFTEVVADCFVDKKVAADYTDILGTRNKGLASHKFESIPKFSKILSQLAKTRET